MPPISRAVNPEREPARASTPVAQLDKGLAITELLSRGSQVRVLPGANFRNVSHDLTFIRIDAIRKRQRDLWPGIPEVALRSAALMASCSHRDDTPRTASYR